MRTGDDQGGDDEGVVATEIDPMDIDLVTTQADVSRDEAAAALKAHGGNVVCGSDGGGGTRTPLFFAAGYGRETVVRFLCQQLQLSAETGDRGAKSTAKYRGGGRCVHIWGVHVA